MRTLFVHDGKMELTNRCMIAGSVECRNSIPSGGKVSVVRWGGGWGGHWST